MKKTIHDIEVESGLLWTLNDAGIPEPTTSLLAWGKSFHDKKRRIVGRTHVGKVVVSTVFLGMDHGFLSEKPVLWETLIIGGRDDGMMHRCSGDRKDAMAMLKRVVRALRTKPQ